MNKFKFDILKLKKLIKFHFNNKVKYYIINIKKLINFAKENLNFITYVKIFFFLPNCELDDLKRIIFILDKFDIKVYEKFPNIDVYYLIDKDKKKIDKNKLNEKKINTNNKKFFFKNLYLKNIKNYKKFTNLDITDSYNSIDDYLNKIWEIIVNKFLIFKYIFDFKEKKIDKIKNLLRSFLGLNFEKNETNNIFDCDLKESEELDINNINKNRFITKNIIKKLFELILIDVKSFLNLNLSLKYIFILYKNLVNPEKITNFYYAIELNKFNKIFNNKSRFSKFNIFSLIDNISNILQKKKYNLFFRKRHKKILKNLFKKKISFFKINLVMLDDIYTLLNKVIKIIENIKIKIYDILSNLCNISYIKFTFLFLSNGSDLNWVLNMSEFTNVDADFINDYKFFLKKKKKILKKIELKFLTSIKSFVNTFYDIQINKFKIDIIKDNLIKSNLYLVDQLTKKYFERNIYLDCVQEGSIGLIKFVLTYNYIDQSNFKELIFLFIKQNISRFLYKNNKLLRLPSYIITIIRKINKVFKDYLEENREEPTIEYVSMKTNISEKKLKKILLLTKNPVSYETIIDDEDTTLGEIIGDFNSRQPDKDIYKNQLKNKFNEVVLTLEDNLIEILKLRYGLDVYRKHTLSEIGEKKGVTRERIRQIQNIILNKLRHPKRSKQLIKFFTPRNKL